MNKTHKELTRTEVRVLDNFIKQIVECTMVQCHRHFSNENESNAKEYLNNNFSDTWSSVKEEVFGDVVDLAKFRRVIHGRINNELGATNVPEKPCLPTPLDLNFS